MAMKKKVVEKKVEKVVEEVVAPVVSKFKCDNCEDSGKRCYMCNA